jgi:hypothetical protein
VLKADNFNFTSYSSKSESDSNTLEISSDSTKIEEVYSRNQCTSSLKFRKITRMALMFTLSELLVILSALFYSFILFPIYASLEHDYQKALWTILLHPLWFRFTAIIPQFIIAVREYEHLGIWKIVFVMHSLYHDAMNRRMYLSNIADPSTMLVVSIMLNLTEILFRLTAHSTHSRVFKFVYQRESEKITEAHAVQLNVEMILEQMSIITAPFMMFLFQDYTILFSWYNGKVVPESAFGIMVVQLITEVITDVICVYFEARRFGPIIYQAWWTICKYWSFV